ncbi:restriction modification system DNA specificity domain protein [Rhodothermus marinus SG0.5JP17-172]|nr:restriction modification system DNA specificity domain protein [Rhodothermus marinus SG0.5JP17-172]
MPFSEAVVVNPSVSLKRGETYPYVDMQAVDPSRPTVGPSRLREFAGGGSRFEPYDTLMARITPCLENGKIARYVPDDEYFGPAFGSTEFIVIRGKEGVTDNDFVFYLTRWREFRSFAIAQMTGSSGRQRVPAESLAGFEVPVPPLPEQRAIARILGTLDDKIELNRRMNETLEAMAQALFKSWFVDLDPVVVNALRAGNPIPEKFAERAAWYGRGMPRPDNALGLPEDILRLFPDRFVDSELGPIPEGWEVKALDEIAHFQNGLALQKYRPKPGEPKLPVVKIAQLRSGRADGNEWASTNIRPDCIIDDGDVVFSWSGSLLLKIWCGGRAALNQHLFKVTSSEYPKWFYYHWIDEHLPEFIHIASGKATTMGHIKRHHLSEAKCVVPEQTLMSKVHSHFESLLVKRIENELESRTLATLRDTLLPKLISGELRVPDVERFLKERGL